MSAGEQIVAQVALDAEEYVVATRLSSSENAIEAPAGGWRVVVAEYTYNCINRALARGNRVKYVALPPHVQARTGTADGWMEVDQPRSTKVAA